jgi:hypothetical protein
MPIKTSGSEGNRHWTQWDVVTAHGTWGTIVQNTGSMWYIYISQVGKDGMIRTVGCYEERSAAETYAGNIADCLEVALGTQEEEGEDPVSAKAIIPRCPHCNALPSGTCEKVPGVALLVDVEEDDSELSYAGETKMCWDGQTTNRNRYNQIEFWCETCDLGWFAPYEGTIS